MALSINPNVDVEIKSGAVEDGAADTVEQVGMIGSCTAGSTSGILIIGRDQQADLGTLLGTGPLVRALQDAFQQGLVQAKVLRITPASAGVLGTPDLSGHTGGGTAGFSGTPNDEYQIVVEFVTGGATGTATFRWAKSLDGPWSQPVLTAASVALGNTGVSATFVNGGTPSASFVAGDEFRVTTRAPAPTANEINTAIDTFAAQAWTEDGRGPVLILIANPTGDTVWQACATKATALHGVHKYVAFVCAARSPNDGESTDTWVTSLVSAKTCVSDLVAICAGRFTLSDAEGIPRDANCAASFVGRCSAIPARESPGATRQAGPYTGPIAGAMRLRPATYGSSPEPVPSITESHIKTLADAGFVTVRRFHGLRGIYFRDGRMASPTSSELAEIHYVRPALEAAHAVRIALLPSINSDASPAALGQYEADANNALATLAARRRIFDGRAVVSTTQNVSQQGYVGVEVFLRRTPTAKWFQVSLKYARTLPGAEG